jgi:hypothetical protein
MARRDPMGARDELKRRMAARLTAMLGADAARNAAIELIGLFHTVEDDWDRIDVTTLAESGESFIENRWLVARVPVQGVTWSRPVDRTVAPGGSE